MALRYLIIFVRSSPVPPLFTYLRPSSDLRYHMSSLLITPWLSVIYARNSTFANYSVNPLHNSPMLQETQTGISLIPTIIVPRCRASTGTTRTLLHLNYLQTKAVNCAVCFGVPGWRLWIRMILPQGFLRNTSQGSCISDVVAGQHLDRAFHILPSQNNPLQAAIEHYVPLKHSQIEARARLIVLSP
jgi:hypothetical protein